MKPVIFLILALLAAAAATAQQEARNWHFGNNSGVTFQNGAPTYLPGGMLMSSEGCASISDRTTGSLLFYTNGVTIWNAAHQVMPNGTGLLGGSSSTQSALIVPDPGNPVQYYVFTAPNLTAGAPQTSGLHYSLVSMATPAGDVLIRNVRLADDVAEKVTGIKNCDGSGYWVVTHAKTTGAFYAFHVTATGVNAAPVVSSYSPPIPDFTAGYIKISPNGAYLAIGSSLSGTSFLGLFDFDTQSGTVSNYKALHPGVGDSFYGMSFSPDNTKLYATGRAPGSAQRLFQFEVLAGDAAAIRNSVVVMAGGQTVGKALQLGPDGKLYVATGGFALDVVHFPNLKSAACSFQTNAVPLSNSCQRGLPNFMDHPFGVFSPGNPMTRDVCRGSGTQIGVLPVAGRVYSWNPAAGLSNPNIANPIATPDATTEYTLSVTNSSGCFVQIQKYVVNVRTIKAIVRQVAPVCEGQTVQLAASGGTTYAWTPTTGLSDSTSPNPWAKVFVSTRFRAIVGGLGCFDTAFVNVDVKPRPTVDFGGNVTVCAGKSVRIGGSAKSGQAYSWTPAAGLDSPTSSNPLASPQITTTYTLRVWEGDCFLDTSVTVTVNTVKATVSRDTIICKGGSVRLSAGGGTEYSWSPAAGLGARFSPTTTAAPDSTTRYRVYVGDGACLDSAFVVVKVVPLPKAAAGNDKTVCKGATVQLGAAPDSGCAYRWSPATDLSNPVAANPTATPTQSRTYILTVTNSDNCTAKDTVVITVGTIKASISPDTVICAGGTANLRAGGGSDYRWSPAEGLDDSASAAPKASPSATTRYTVVVTSGTCIDSASVLIAVVPLPPADAGADIALCPGETRPLGTPPLAGLSYSWTPPDGLDNPQSATPRCSSTVPSQYILTVRNSMGCASQDTVAVDIATLTASISPDTTICPGSAARLRAGGGAAYSWTPAEGLDNPNIPEPVARPAATQKYTVIVRNHNGCSDTASVTVTVSPAFLTVAASDTALCIGQTAELFASGGTAYSWIPPDGLDNPTIPNPRATPFATTMYRVAAWNGTCRDTAFITLTVLPLPTAIAGEDATICEGESVVIGGAPVAGYSYTWSPATTLDNPHVPQPVAQPERNTRYTLTVTDENGCEQSDTTTVMVTPVDERVFALTPAVITLSPGEKSSVSLSVPAGVETWTATLRYHPQFIGFDSVTSLSDEISVGSADEHDGALTLKGSGANGEVVVRFLAYLPEQPEAAPLPLTLSADAVAINGCDVVTATGAALELGEFCAKNLRFVSGTGKRYFLNAAGSRIEFGVGLSGRVRLELHDYAGRLSDVIADSFLGAGTYTADISAPPGVYLCRIISGAFHDARTLVIVR